MKYFLVSIVKVYPCKNDVVSRFVIVIWCYHVFSPFFKGQQNGGPKNLGGTHTTFFSCYGVVVYVVLSDMLICQYVNFVVMNG